MTEVVIVQSVLRRYRERFYLELRQRLAAENVRLRLVHSTPERDARGDVLALPWSVRIPARDVRVGPRTLVWQPYLPALRGVDLIVAEQASQLLLNYVLLARRHAGGPPVAFWGHGRNFAAQGSRTGEAVKRVISRRAHWWFAYTQLTAEVVAGLGYPPERITVVDNATDSRALARAVEAVDPAQVRAVAQELGLRGTCVGLFLGSLEPEKRLEFLLTACRAIRGVLPEFELVLAGAGSRAGEIAALDEPGVVYAGHRTGGELAPLLAMAKVALVPGWVGLVLVDAFAAGLPLVTSASGPHPPEIAYLRDGHNGLLVEDGGDPQVYATAVTALLRDEPRRRVLAAAARDSGRRYTAENMAERFAGGIRAALAARR